MDTTETVTTFIVDEFAPDLDPARLDPEYDLLDNGIIDSLALLTVLAWVEDRFGVAVDAGQIDQDDFRSVSAICALIETSASAEQCTPLS